MALIKPKISVIIPTFNGAKELPSLLKQLKLQTININEIIIIDSQSEDRTTEIAVKFGAKVIAIRKNEFDHGGTRNFAAAKASGDVLIFMTQDAIPANKEMVEFLISPLKEKNIILSYARQIPKQETKITDRFLRLYNYPDQSVVKSQKDIDTMGIRTFQSSNVCAAYRRREFEQLGRFHQPIVSNEDMLFAAKAIFAGYQVAYTAEAKVKHSHNYKNINLLKRYFDIGSSLDNEPRLKFVKKESQGIDFLIKQLKYVKSESGFSFLPEVFFEAICKYIGYKLGETHRYIPFRMKKYLGLHAGFWIKKECNVNTK